ncbi:Phosphatidylserine decarboxylase-related protein [Anaerovibrio sp. JC8]|uniref:phosphatidylserine decarboxylase n=1 Tax=Anaerovibrio sp. JC8 TaxID=1240085 RepID=UPI000A097446|nr:phosphatidylserine decarboxylase [Anaerovibrio sp. JC8]ORU00800.1 Phosphatidylserine decarboxylase-related protein [Anaerovibrio sp. JC8]
MQRKVFTLLLGVVLLLYSLGAQAAVPKSNLPHSQATISMMKYLNDDPALMKMMEKSIAKARVINPDPNTNPIQSVNDLYSFLDWAVTCMPWNVLSDASYPTLYSHIDQSVDYFWFIVDQPLEELENRGYYYPSLQYHEPIATWCREYSQEWGRFLSTKESWNDTYYQRIKQDPSMNMQYGWYADYNAWNSFNDWFSRHLVDPSVRPIADSSVVAPADSTPQGIWRIDETGNLIQKKGVAIKAANFTSIAQLMGPDSAYGDAFNGGTVTHTFLDVNDYHRYHFPVSGKIVELRKIPGTNGAGGVTEWDPKLKRYYLIDSIPGWQTIETRDCVVIDTEEYGLVAILPIGMSQICSCNWEENLAVGDVVRKGDPMGYFLFGGSDIVMVFQSTVDVSLICPQKDSGDGYKHVLMGEPYASLVLSKH